MCVFVEFCTVCPGYERFTCAHICPSKADDWERQLVGTVYRMTTQPEHESSHWFEQQILKQKGVDHRDHCWDKDGRYVHVVEHMFLCAFLCEREVLEREGVITRQGEGGGVTMETISTSAPGFPLDWPPSPPPPLFKVYSSLSLSVSLSRPLPLSLSLSRLPHPWARLTFWTKWHYKIITFYHLSAARWKPRWEMLVQTRFLG